jgi:ubiquinone/menaquinone biosynthesis C-methylase UbiE
MTVADVGAGTGLFTLLFAHTLNTRGQVIAVDIVPAFLDYIRAQAAAVGLQNVRAVLCTDRSVELEPESLDLAFICDAYHHFEYPKETLRSLHRALHGSTSR